MRDFALSLVCAGVVSGVIGMIFEGNATGKYVKLVLSLCVVAMVFSAFVVPWTKKDLPEFDFAAEQTHIMTADYENFVIENSRLEMCRTLREMILKKTGITPDDIDIQFSVRKENGVTNVDIASVTVYCTELCGNDAAKEYICGLTGKNPIITASEENG